MNKGVFYGVGMVVLAFFFSGCATIDPFLYKELRDLDGAIHEARVRGADAQCPEAFQAVLDKRDKAEETYWSCRTQEAMEMAGAARDEANALCPAGKDSDGDGVPDGMDRCPETPAGVRVDAKGCPVDSDGDGVADYQDRCPGTPKGVRVDTEGCPLDSDGDGVADYLDQCLYTPKGVRVDAVGCPLDSDGDGVYDFLDNCPDTPMGIKVDPVGCPLDSDHDGVADHVDQCPGTPFDVRVDERGCWVLTDVLFDTAKWEIKARAYPSLDEVAAVLKRNPFLKLEIQGHTDSRGGTAYNQRLSENRARAVMEYLIRKGIRKQRLFAVGFGLSRPMASNATAEGQARNRRVELKPIY